MESMSSQSPIQIRHLSYSVGGRALFQNFSWQFPNKGASLWVGDSGRGKTTLARLLAGHLTPESGKILFDGKTYTHPGRHCFLVSQENDLWNWMTVAESLRFAETLPNTLPCTEELISVFGMKDCLGLYPKDLSEGQKKRLAILRGLILKPRVLIIDEHLSSLDKTLRKNILIHLLKVSTQEQIALVLISHFPEDFSHEDFTILDFSGIASSSTEITHNGQ